MVNFKMGLGISNYFYLVRHIHAKTTTKNPLFAISFFRYWRKFRIELCEISLAFSAESIFKHLKPKGVSR